MCCGCEGSIGTCSSNLAYVLEKLASFVAMTAVILCMVITLTICLGIGVGLGYNYCFVDMKIMTEEPDTSSPGFLRTGYTDVPSFRRSMPTSTQPRRMGPMPAIKHTMTIPLNGDIDFPSLLSKLRARNRNVTLELIT